MIDFLWHWVVDPVLSVIPWWGWLIAVAAAAWFGWGFVERLWKWGGAKGAAVAALVVTAFLSFAAGYRGGKSNAPPPIPLPPDPRAPPPAPRKKRYLLDRLLGRD